MCRSDVSALTAATAPIDAQALAGRGGPRRRRHLAAKSRTGPRPPELVAGVAQEVDIAQVQATPIDVDGCDRLPPRGGAPVNGGQAQMFDDTRIDSGTAETSGLPG